MADRQTQVSTPQARPTSPGWRAFWAGMIATITVAVLWFQWPEMVYRTKLVRDEAALPSLPDIPPKPAADEAAKSSQLARAGQYGDMFGAFTSLLTAITTIGIVATLFYLHAQTKAAEDASRAAWDAAATAKRVEHDERTARLSERLDRQHGAIVKTQFIIASQAGDLRSVLFQIGTVRDDKHRATMLPEIVPSLCGLRIELGEIIFLALTEKVSSLSETVAAQKAYEVALVAIEHRNEAKNALVNVTSNHRSSFDPHKFSGEIIPQPEHEFELAALRKATDEMFSAIDLAIARLDSAVEALARAGTAMFPGRGFLKVNPQDPLAKPVTPV